MNRFALVFLALSLLSGCGVSAALQQLEAATAQAQQAARANARRPPVTRPSPAPRTETSVVDPAVQARLEQARETARATLAAAETNVEQARAAADTAERLEAQADVLDRQLEAMLARAGTATPAPTTNPTTGIEEARLAVRFVGFGDRPNRYAGSICVLAPHASHARPTRRSRHHRGHAVSTPVATNERCVQWNPNGHWVRGDAAWLFYPSSWGERPNVRVRAGFAAEAPRFRSDRTFPLIPGTGVIMTSVIEAGD